MFAFKQNNMVPIISDKFRNSDTNLVYLFTNARDEPNIAEWITHHLLLGFDKIYVFDHLSKEPIKKKLDENIFNGKLKVFPVKGSGNIKINLMKNAVNISKQQNVSWMLYLDADEFLLLNKYNNIKDFLRCFPQADSVGINWLMFGTSGHKKQPEGLLTENFIKSEIRLDRHVKTFVRPYIVKDVINPHFYVISNPTRCYTANNTRMNMGSFNPQPLPFINTSAYIAHYYTQSEEEYRRRKGREMDDGTGHKLGSSEQIHEQFNSVINNQLQNKYSKMTKIFLKDHGIEL